MTHRPDPRDFHRIAVLNRGEPAVRFMRALRDYNLDRGVELEAVAFYTDPDAGAPFVRMADEAVHLGPATLATEFGPVSAYCHAESVLRLLHESRCDAVWPGWGFVSEDTRFVEALEAAGITFIGPSARAMLLLGDKIESKKMADAAGVPMAPWRLIDPSDSVEALEAAAAQVGFPLMVKASAGGGGRGIRKVERPEALAAAVRDAAEEVRKVFGQGGLFMESCITGARHVEVQFAGGADGRATALGVRDCSIQRRNQKVIEEAPSPVLPAEVEATLCASTVRLAEMAGYQGVGTAEFLYEPATGRASFLEVNSRLQVEHTITEVVMGCDLVQAQIDIARGLDWGPPTGPPRGCAIEVRLNAENPERGFAPSPGLVRVFRPPAGPGVRVDSGVVEGMEIAPDFDSMIAKVITWAPTRRQAIARMSRALGELGVVVEDGTTNKAFLLDLLGRQAFVEATADTSWLDRAMAAGQFEAPAWEFEALVVAAIVEYRLQRHADVQRFFAQAQNGIPQNLPAPGGMTLDLRLRGCDCALRVFGQGADRYLVGVGADLHVIAFEAMGPHSALLHLNGARHQVFYSYGRTGIAVEIDGAMHPVERASGGVVKAHAPAMVVHVAVEEGQQIQPGDTICILEAMKMEMAVFSQEAGVVKAVLIQPNQQVVAGQPLVMLEPTVGDAPRAAARQIKAPAVKPRPLDWLFKAGRPAPEIMDRLSEATAKEVIEDLMGALRAVLQGFDAPPELSRGLTRMLGEAVDLAGMEQPQRWAPLAGLLETFANVEALFERDLLTNTDASTSLSAELGFYEFCRLHHEGEQGAHEALRPMIREALRGFGIHTLDPSDALREALWRMATSHAHGSLSHQLCSSLLRALMALNAAGVNFEGHRDLRHTLTRVEQVSNPRHPFVADNARQAVYVLFDQSRYVERRQVVEKMLGQVLQALTGYSPDSDEARAWIDGLAGAPHSIFPLLLLRADPRAAETPYVAEAIIRRIYAGSRCERHHLTRDRHTLRAHFEVDIEGRGPTPLLEILGHAQHIARALEAAREAIQDPEVASPRIVEIVLQDTHLMGDLGAELDAALADAALDGLGVERLTISWCHARDRLRHRTWQTDGEKLIEVNSLRDIHPESARRLELDRLSEFDLERLDSPEQIVALRGRARTNPRDERIFVFAEVRNIPARPHEAGARYLWEFEQAYYEGLRVLRDHQSRQGARRRLHWNLLTIIIRPTLEMSAEDLVALSQRFESPTRGLGLQKVVLRVPIKADGALAPEPMDFSFIKRNQQPLKIGFTPPDRSPVRAMTPYEMRVVTTRRMGFTYPYEIARLLEGHALDEAMTIPGALRGRFVEMDLDADGHRLQVVQRPYGQNTCGVVVGLMTQFTDKFPDGMERVWIAADASHSMCALAEPECRRLLAAMDLAQQRGLPIEWLPVSAGARIAMDSGTENLDWTARVLRRIVEFTQDGGEMNIIVAGVNVGAQSYWNAEATMLMHTRGILIMTPGGSMVLTGKKALEYSGGVAAEDERGIGGFERVMGPNGQAQYSALDLSDAYRILLDHYRYTYRKPGERHPRPFLTRDPADRSILDFPYRARHGESFCTVGELFDDASNPERKKPFAIREVMRATIDQDGGHLERFQTMRHAETAVVWDAHIGGWPVCLLGIESRPLPRPGRIPMDGPDTWTGGTLFPHSSRKVARAINAASGVRPVVVLANLSGFDGSPESLRKLQLEYGAEIGRAVVNFQGPIIFVVISRYHGGAYVVFSKALNPNLTALALEGTFASVIGGGPAAAVVFPREVRRRAEADPRLDAARRALEDAPDPRKPLLRERLDALFTEVLFEHQGAVAREFNAIHTVDRAVAVGSLDAVIAPAALRPEIIKELEANARAAPKATNGHGHDKLAAPIWDPATDSAPRHLDTR